ncbi:MFS transporter [Bifidobacterium gallicum]|nr:MFS transporter [Bifidobacterium gallicum]
MTQSATSPSRAASSATAPSSSANQQQQPHDGMMHGGKLALVFIALALAVFVGSLSETIAATALPTIVGDLGGVEIMQWVSTMYILTSTIVMPFYGRMGDRIGRKHLIMVAMALYAIGKVICAIAPNMALLLTGRAVSGLGGGGVIILSQAILADIVSARARGKYMGAIGAVFAVSTVLGPVIGGWVVQDFGWRMVFWCTIPLDIIAITMTGLFLRKDAHKASGNSIDMWGIIMSTAFTVTLVLAASWGGNLYAWDSWQILGLFFISLLCAIAFVWIERRAQEPVIPVRLFKNRNFVLVTVTGMLVYGAVAGATNYLPTFLQIVEDKSPTIAGLMMTPMMAGSLITSTVTGFLASITGKYKWMPIAMGAVMTFGFVMLSSIGVGTPAILLMTYFFLIGFGQGLGSQILVLIVQNEFPHTIVGTATAGNNFFRQIGTTLGTAIVGSVFTSRLVSIVTPEIPSNVHISIADVTPQMLNKLPESLHGVIAQGYSEALTPIFRVFVPILAVATVLMFFIKQHPLATTINNKGTAALEAAQNQPSTQQSPQAGSSPSAAANSSPAAAHNAA